VPLLVYAPGTVPHSRVHAWVETTQVAPTILQLLGLDQNRLWFLHNGRNEKLTDFGGNVIQEMLA